MHVLKTPEPVDWWQQRIKPQQEIDASIAAKADYEYLYDKPYDDKSKVRVAGPFTVESLSPHRTLAVGADDELIDPLDKKREPPTQAGGGTPDFVSVILENLRTAGVQQAHKEDRIEFSSLKPWAGDHVCAEGRYEEGDVEKRAAVFIGPEFGTVARSDLAAAAREAAEAGIDVLVACAFSYEAHASEFNKLGALPVLKARERLPGSCRCGRIERDAGASAERCLVAILPLHWLLPRPASGRAPVPLLGRCRSDAKVDQSPGDDL